jgi:hypothetical protein
LKSIDVGASGKHAGDPLCAWDVGQGWSRQHAGDDQQIVFVQRRDLNAQQNLMRTRWRRLLDVDDAEHLCGIAELFNLYGAHINSSSSRVRPRCEPT